MLLVESQSCAGRPRLAPRARGLSGARVYVALTGLIATTLVAAMAAAVAVWTPAAVVALGLAAISAIWIAGGAATAILGLCQPAPPRARVPDGWRPSGRTAILVTLCGEPAPPLAQHLAGLRRGLDRLGLDGATPVFVLSDTADPTRIAAEEAALAPLVAAGKVTYRRRARNDGRKPGNIADWLERRGDGHDYMLVLDADSRMSPWRVRDLIHRIETRPKTGLVQASMALVPGQSRFGRHQRLSARLLSPNFVRGLAAWAGATGNYWGHNAIIRVEAFRAAAALPSLSGRAPFGGPVLSHDFIEAAWIRRAGWAVEHDPYAAGSAEDAPQTLDAFHRRDRRWCQGNLQHLRLLAEPGLHPVSRLHLVSGVVSYLAAPAWLILVLLFASGAMQVSGALPFALVAGVLVAPKLCALASWMSRARSAGRRRVILRAAAGELALSSLVAPLVMARQAGSVAAVVMGRDCGWKSPRPARRAAPRGTPEAALGLALIATALLAGPAATNLWLLPMALPLIGAPILQRSLDRGA